MRKVQCLLFVLKQSYIFYYIVCMTVPLKPFREGIKLSVIPTLRLIHDVLSSYIKTASPISVLQDFD